MYKLNYFLKKSIVDFHIFLSRPVYTVLAIKTKGRSWEIRDTLALMNGCSPACSPTKYEAA